MTERSRQFEHQQEATLARIRTHVPAEVPLRVERLPRGGFKVTGPRCEMVGRAQVVTAFVDGFVSSWRAVSGEEQLALLALAAVALDKAEKLLAAKDETIAKAEALRAALLDRLADLERAGRDDPERSALPLSGPVRNLRPNARRNPLNVLRLLVRTDAARRSIGSHLRGELCGGFSGGPLGVGGDGRGARDVKRKPAVRSTRVPESRCFNCGGILDGASAAGRPPVPNDYSVCWYCGAVARFGEDLRLVALLPFEAIPADVAETAARMVAAVKRRMQ
jgi:hypothetical protein